MIKKSLLTAAFSFFMLAVSAQDENTAQRIKYITKAPDGTTSMIIYDDSRNNSLELESKNNFYKYELVDINTGEPVYSFNNKGKSSVLHKSEIAEGDYVLRVYTKQFIVTSSITIAHKDYFLRSEEVVASNEN